MSLRQTRASLITAAGIAITALAAPVVVVSIGWDGAGAYNTGKVIPCLDAEDRERLKALGVKALDDAFKNQIEHLFAVWMKDLHDQPHRAHVGVTNAVKAWIGARAEAEKFAPPECPKATAR